MKLVSAQTAAQLDKEASALWGLNPFALVEAVGRTAAYRFVQTFSTLFEKRQKIVVFSGSGNNGADAMIMLKSLIMRGKADGNSLLVLNKTPDKIASETPRAEAFKALVKMNVPFLVWDSALPVPEYLEKLRHFDIIIDGIAGTGLEGQIKKQAAEMVHVINEAKLQKIIVSIDVPSGGFDNWEKEMPIVRADATLAIEPQKLCLYKPGVRPFAGKIVPVEGIFPQALIDSYAEAELLDWETEKEKIPKIKPDAYKYTRGTVEIHAGSIGCTGAAHIAAKGAEVSGAGLIRLAVDEEIYPILAASPGGVMTVPETAFSAESSSVRFTPDALLLGPGWDGGATRLPVLRRALEQKDIPLILDAGAIHLVKKLEKSEKIIFNGKTILTPHAGEFSAFSGIPKEEILTNPLPILKKAARERKAVILFKSHVLFIVAEDGRTGIIDGMTPVLGMGGSGDLLAGLCAGIAARMKKYSTLEKNEKFDTYTCACAAASLLIAAGKLARGFGFIDPLVLADIVSQTAGAAWL